MTGIIAFHFKSMFQPQFWKLKDIALKSAVNKAYIKYEDKMDGIYFLFASNIFLLITTDNNNEPT